MGIVAASGIRPAITATSLAVGVVALHVGAAVFFSSHNPYTSTVFPPCPILAVTGWQCPGCGGTRAAYSLLHGDLATAVRMNPLVVACYPVGALMIGMIASSKNPRISRIFTWSAVGILAVATIYVGIIRNVLGH